jgi:hypothetical protein
MIDKVHVEMGLGREGGREGGWNVSRPEGKEILLAMSPLWGRAHMSFGGATGPKLRE